MLNVATFLNTAVVHTIDHGYQPIRLQGSGKELSKPLFKETFAGSGWFWLIVKRLIKIEIKVSLK